MVCAYFVRNIDIPKMTDNNQSKILEHMRFIRSHLFCINSDYQLFKIIADPYNLPGEQIKILKFTPMISYCNS